jgi:hypothetical protein
LYPQILAEPIGDPDSLCDLRFSPRCCTSSEKNINKRDGNELGKGDNGGDVDHPMIVAVIVHRLRPPSSASISTHGRLLS